MGVGRYLLAVTVTPLVVEVGWCPGGIVFDVETVLDSIANIGTNDYPIAAARISIKSRVKTVVSDMSYEDKYYVTGEGKLARLSN